MLFLVFSLYALLRAPVSRPGLKAAAPINPLFPVNGKIIQVLIKLVPFFYKSRIFLLLLQKRFGLLFWDFSNRLILQFHQEIERPVMING